MKYLYVLDDEKAHANLVATADPHEWEVTNVVVRKGYRGGGFGSEVLKLVTADADKEGVVLLLTSGLGPGYSGGLSTEQLRAWYERHGFDAIAPGSYPGTTLMQRVPHPLVPPSGTLDAAARGL